jgi:hypothetical protein
VVAVKEQYFVVQNALYPACAETETLMLALDFWRIVERNGKPYKKRANSIHPCSAIPIQETHDDDCSPRMSHGKKTGAHKKRVVICGQRKGMGSP